jgi:hypothetical protein
MGVLGARVVSMHLGDVGRVEHGWKRPDGAQVRTDPLDGRLVEDPGPAGGDEGVVGERVPRAEVELVEGGEGDQIADAGDPLLVTAAETDRPELGQGADRLARTGPDGLNPGDKRGPDGAEPHAEHGEPPVGWRDLGRARKGSLGHVLA